MTWHAGALLQSLVVTTTSLRACYQIILCVALQLKVQYISAKSAVVRFAWWYCMALYGLQTRALLCGLLIEGLTTRSDTVPDTMTFGATKFGIVL